MQQVSKSERTPLDQKVFNAIVIIAVVILSVFIIIWVVGLIDKSVKKTDNAN